MTKITKIFAAVTTLVLAVLAALASYHKPNFTTLHTIYYTHGSVGCFILTVNTTQFTTNGNPGTGTQAMITGEKFWGNCSAGIGTHPAHFHF